MHLSRSALFLPLLSCLGACDEELPAGPLGLSFGTNDPGAVSLESFRLLEEGGEAPVSFGLQGRWMVVLAARLDGVDGTSESAAITVELRSGDDTLSLYDSPRVPLWPTSGGHLAMNLFVVLGDPEEWQGRPVEVTLHAEVGAQASTADLRLVMPTP